MECSCSLKTRCPEEHEVMRKKKPFLGAVEVNCPAHKGQSICMWCCLHIVNLGDTIKRAYYSDLNKEYYEKLPKIFGMDFDEMYEYCDECFNSQTQLL